MNKKEKSKEKKTKNNNNKNKNMPNVPREFLYLNIYR